MQIVYETRGGAREYAPLAVNLYNGCSHGCKYCYAPKVLHRIPEAFYSMITPRKDAIKNLTHDLAHLESIQDDREILLCFTCDPYQDLDVDLQLTRQAITSMIAFGRRFTVLTKGGARSARDFDLLQEYNEKCRYGVTLTYASNLDSRRFEPGAAVTSERIAVLKEAHGRGIKNWVSLEPASNIEDVMDLVKRTKDFTDEYRIGKLNYDPRSKLINWKQFKKDVVEFCDQEGINYKLKMDLEVL